MSSTTPLGGGYSRASASVPPTVSTPKRPASIQELAELAEVQWDPSKDFKFWLKVAEKARHSAQDYDLHGDLENAFVEYARAATLILHKIPKHRDYDTRLTRIQKDTLMTKGKGVLERMDMLKPPLVERHNAWEKAQVTPRNQARPSSYDAECKQRDGERERDRERERGNTPSRKLSMANGHRRDERESRQIWYPDTEQDRRRRHNEELPPSLPQQVKARTPQRTRAEQEGILQRQRQAEEEARAVRSAALYHHTSPSSNLNPSGFVSIPVPMAPALTPQRPTGQSSTRSASDSSSTSTLDTPPLLPLESPTRRYEADETDNETDEAREDELYRRVAELSMGSRDASSSTLVNPFGGPAPPPITTTSSPPPNISAISYPQLMTQHQRTQGYIPSYQAQTIDNASSAFQLQQLQQQSQQGMLAPQPKHLYQNILPPPSQPAATRDRAYMYGPREPPTHAQSHSHSPSPRPPIPQRPPYEMPVPQPHTYISQPQSQSSLPVPQRVSPSRSPAPSAKPFSGLRTVSFPRAVLPRFLSIAAVNTAKNRETCGLLLGKVRGEMGRKLVVTTLLIPKQHSTSDTCNMDEEELVLEFTETRGLITLGWIHTHPTQSCFMSSVDLHTHSGFQRMLPESFAVVCAPQHTPNFGIFRLTDPPGLQAILNCEQKNAFHPHPELPIYTDADKGHVQMKDLPLEIVDLR